MAKQLACILVGDHLGQVKKVLLPSGEITILSDCAVPDSSNPVVSIEPLRDDTKHLIGYKNGSLYIHDCIHGKTKKCETSGSESLIKALPTGQDEIVLIYEKEIVIEGKKSNVIKQKKGQILNAKVQDDKIAIVGKDIPLKVFDLKTKNKIFEADLPEKNWLGIQPGCVVSNLDFVGDKRIATCSKSDSVIRVYDIQQPQSSTKLAKPIIKVDINQTAFNEHAEANRFVSVASTGDIGHSIVVGSNVGQLLAIDLRFNIKSVPNNKKKKLQPKTSKILGSFKGARGATIKDIKIIPNSQEETGHKVISCCLDRYLRIHNFSRTTRQLDKHVYLKTKPVCCSPVFYQT